MLHLSLISLFFISELFKIFHYSFRKILDFLYLSLDFNINNNKFSWLHQRRRTLRTILLFECKGKLLSLNWRRSLCIKAFNLYFKLLYCEVLFDCIHRLGQKLLNFENFCITFLSGISFNLFFENILININKMFMHVVCKVILKEFF